jgi:hypothetical protein
MRKHVLRTASIALLGLTIWGTSAVACTSDAECTDGLACNGVETCNLGTSLCEGGSPVTCPPPGQCEVSVDCQEPSGSCVATPKPDFIICQDGNDCTVGDTCQAGVCTGGPGADSDGDGDCDDEEVACGCNPNDEREICHLPNRLIGRIGSGAGEVLLEWYSPTVRRVMVATDDACATAGQCVNKRCTRGKVRDFCTVDADCNQPPLTCRAIVNFADYPDIVLDFAQIRRVDVPGLTPVSRACSRKVDLAITPDYATNRFRFKASGTVDGRLRRDRDTIIFGF